MRKKGGTMPHDHEYFRQRALEARAAAFCREECEETEIAGQLALAYSALARRGKSAAKAVAAAEEEVAG
jgi:hypothetical protein